MTIRKNLKSSRINIRVLILAALLTLIPFLKAEANSFTTLYEGTPFGDNSLFFQVSAEKLEGDLWKFNYSLSNPGINLLYLSVGLVKPDLSEAYNVVGSPVVPGPASSQLSPGSSLMVLFPMPWPPGRAATNEEYAFSITFDKFVEGQYIYFQGDTDFAQIAPQYTLPDGSTAPEPTAFLLLGSGILGLRLLIRKRCKT